MVDIFRLKISERIQQYPILEIGNFSKNKQNRYQIVMPQNVRVCSQNQYMFEILKRSQQTNRKCRHLEKYLSSNADRQLSKIKKILKVFTQSAQTSRRSSLGSCEQKRSKNHCSHRFHTINNKQSYCEQYYPYGVQSPQLRQQKSRASNGQCKMPTQQYLTKNNIQSRVIVSTNPCSIEHNPHKQRIISYGEIYEKNSPIIQDYFSGPETDLNPYDFRPNRVQTIQKNKKPESSLRSSRSVSENAHSSIYRHVGRFGNPSVQDNLTNKISSKCSLEQRMQKQEQSDQKYVFNEKEEGRIHENKSIHYSSESKMTLGNKVSSDSNRNEKKGIIDCHRRKESRQKKTGKKLPKLPKKKH